MNSEKKQIVECVPNFSEGRRKEVIDAITDAARSVPGVTILDCESDKNHNRMVLTFVGAPDAVKRGAMEASAKAVELIDLTKHAGEHPRMGAVDVVPFVPLKDITTEECVEIAKSFAEEFARRFNVPVFLYEAAATREERRNLASVREGQFEGLRELIGKDPSRRPDFGPNSIHPTAGATAVGARPILIAYNVDLSTNDLSVAKKIAHNVRERDGGLPKVKALGFELKDRNLVQVSMNLTDFHVTSIHTAFEQVAAEAAKLNVGVEDSEVVGLVPLEALVLAFRHNLKLKDFRSDQIIENKLFEKENSEDTGKSLLDLSLEEFASRVASENPVPGGGSVSAYAGALSASLVAMVCNLTLHKKGYEGVETEVQSILKSALELQPILLELVNEDAKSYSLVTSAVKLPKTTDEEKATRKEALRKALKQATEIPVHTMENSYKAYLLAAQISDIGNRNAKSDAQTAIELSKAAVAGTFSNVKLNLEGLKEEREFSESIRNRTIPILEKLSLQNLDC